MSSFLMSNSRPGIGLKWRNWRNWPARIPGIWRRSLQLRTVTLTVALSAIALLFTGLYMSYSIAGDLFESTRSQVLASSARATASAQSLLTSSDASTRTEVQSVVNSARSSIIANSGSRQLALLRTPDQEDSPLAPTPFTSPQLRGDVITPELRAAVAEQPDVQHWQSVTLIAEDGTASAGLIVGSQLDIPAAGRYELYIAYDMKTDEQTLLFVQQTLWAGFGVLVLLIGAVTWVVVRFVISPIRVAAETSQRLAAGEFDVRIPVRGDDVIATLARSFNEMADGLERQIKELAALSQLQQRFVSDVSHELRTPLTTIRLAADVLNDQRRDFAGATGRTVELLHTQVERFEVLLADLLEISRYDAGSVALETEAVNLVRLAEDAIDGVRSLAEAEGSDLRLVAEGGFGVVHGDPRRIRRILTNLLGNAIEHGEGKPIVVSVDSSETAVAFAVRDYGLGMTEAVAGQIFDRFWRADPSRKRTLGGTGLGLAIAREDAALHGGVIELWSTPGGGSCFRVTLPREAGGSTGRSPLPLPPDDAHGTAPHFADPAREDSDA